ncbi:MAG: spinster family MFS transporter [Sphingomonadaceae bacterium]
MNASMSDAAKTAQPDSGPYAWYVVAVLILAYTFSFIDRQILTLMVGPIRATLGISDFQLSLLHGLAFALFYSVLGIPIGMMVDRKKRTTIIAVGIAVWSVMTSLCGFAQNFVQLFVARMGVGVGEAALSPGAYSMISDYFPPHQRPRALSLYTSAAYIGGGIATMAGGTLIALMPPLNLPGVGTMQPWQAIFIVVGLPGLLVALLVATVREPQRTGLKVGAHPNFSQVRGHLSTWRSAYGLLIVGYAVSGIMWNGAIAWIPTYFIRHFGWTASQVSLPYGLITIGGGVGGINLGGWIATRLRQCGRRDANIIVGLIAIAVAMPSGIAATFAGTPNLALALFAVFLFGCAIPWGGAVAALQEITPNQMRGQVSAIYLFCLSLIGIGVGPTLVAGFTDHLFGDDAALGKSIALTIAIAAPVSALLLSLARKPYCRALGAVAF